MPRAVVLPAIAHPSGIQLISVGSSAGGVPGIERILRELPSGAAATLIVQHMPATFTASFAARLDASSRMTVREALVEVDRHGGSIGLIISDMNMPNVGGLSLLKALRETEEFRHTPFFVVTADPTSDDAKVALRSGATGIMGKPFHQNKIVSLVRRWQASTPDTTGASTEE